MKIARHDIVTAAENADIYEDEYTIRPDYTGRDMGSDTCPAVVLPEARRIPELLVALAVLFTENGRAEDAIALAQCTNTDAMGRDVVAYWPGVEITD